MTYRRALTALSTLGLAILVGGCDDGPFAGSGSGRVEAEVRDTPNGASDFSGTAAGDFSVSIRSTSGTWVDLGSPNGITVQLQSALATTVHGEQDVPAGRYDRVRLTLSDVTVSVDAGGEVGGTVLVTDRSTVVGGETPLIIELTVPEFDAGEADGTVELSFDLNVEEWLNGQAFNVGLVPNSSVEGRVSVVVGGG